MLKRDHTIEDKRVEIKRALRKGAPTGSGNERGRAGVVAERSRGYERSVDWHRDQARCRIRVHERDGGSDQGSERERERNKDRGRDRDRDRDRGRGAYIETATKEGKGKEGGKEVEKKRGVKAKTQRRSAREMPSQGKDQISWKTRDKVQSNVAPSPWHMSRKCAQRSIN
jgi:hypothetical protein